MEYRKQSSQYVSILELRTIVEQWEIPEESNKVMNLSIRWGKRKLDMRMITILWKKSGPGKELALEPNYLVSLFLNLIQCISK